MSPAYSGRRPYKLQLPRIIRFEDPDETAMVSVKVRNVSGYAKLTVEAYDRVVATLGERVAWWVDARGPQVVAKAGGREVLVARKVVLEIGPRSRLHYRDGDFLNLRPANVRAGLSPASRAPKQELTIAHDVNYQRRTVDGFTVAGVKVEGTRKRAWMERSAYEALIESYGCRPWYVRGSGRAREVVFESACPGVEVSVAGALMGVTTDKRVAPLDGDHLNLRSSNFADALPRH